MREREGAARHHPRRPRTHRGRRRAAAATALAPAAVSTGKGRERGEGEGETEVRGRRGNAEEEGVGGGRRRRLPLAPPPCPRPRRRESGRAREREEGRGGGRSWMEKQKLGYIFGFMDSDEKPEKPNESREGAGEVHKKRGKPLQKEPAPSNEGHTIKDPTEKINWGDVAGCSGWKLHGILGENAEGLLLTWIIKRAV